MGTTKDLKFAVLDAESKAAIETIIDGDTISTPTSGSSKPFSAGGAYTELALKADLVDGKVPTEQLPASTTNWGDIGGTLSAQTDLNTLVGSKVDKDIINQDNIPRIYIGNNKQEWTKGIAGFTGILAIEITGLYALSNMLGSMEINILEVGDTKAFSRILVKGEWGASVNTWNYGTAKELVSSASVAVRFAKNTSTSKVYVLFGETTTVWANIRVGINIPMCSWNTGLALGFNITTLSSLTGITTEITSKTINIAETVYELTGTNITVDNGTIQYKTLSSSVTLTESLTSGQSLTLRLIGADTYPPTMPTMTWVGSSGNITPTWTALDVMVLWKEGSTLFGSYVGSGV